MAAWTKPSTADLKQEYFVEIELKKNGFFNTEKEFITAANAGKAVTVTPSMNKKIAYRSNTSSKQMLLNLIRSYRSYPQFRNEKTIEVLYDRIGAGQSMTMPIVLKFKDGKMRVLGGNTRMDVAFQLGVNPTVLMVDA